LRFKKSGVEGIIRDVLLPWYNSYRFFILNANRYETITGHKFVPVDIVKEFKNGTFKNYLDQWLVCNTDNLIMNVRKEMNEFKLYSVVPKILTFLEDMTNWYIKLNRSRLKGELNDDNDWLYALTVLYNANLVLSKLMAAYAPFLSEHIYQNLKRCLEEDKYSESVHFNMIPNNLFYGSNDKELENKVEGILRAVNRMREIIELTRKLRVTHKLSNSKPLSKLVILHDDEI